MKPLEETPSHSDARARVAFFEFLKKRIWWATDSEIREGMMKVIR